jgi:MFS family permease
VYYITYVFNMAGYKGNSTLLASSISYIINVVMTVPALIWQDKWGRRPTMMVGAFFMTAFMFANAGIMGAQGTVVPGGVGGVPQQSMKLSGAPATGLIACTYLFVASYAPTWGPASWTYPPELFPLRLRGKGVALATSGNWAFNTALGLFVPPAFKNIKWQTYIVFGVFNVVMFLHVYFMFPETAGKTLEETEAMFGDPNGIPYIGTPAWKTGKNTTATLRMERGNLDIKPVTQEMRTVEEPAAGEEIQRIPASKK